MKKYIIICVLCAVCGIANAQKDSHMKSTIDILHEAPNVNLVALYGPEHGVRGDEDRR